MKLNLNKFYVVYALTKYSEKVDVFDGRPTTITSLKNQFRGGLEPKDIEGIYTTKKLATSVAEKLFKKHSIKR
ncbi:hypothetical protein [Aquimarina algiphila]|uniref:hypothetical protein n=1 Tax=Aquimarina algiphila TaxID=2047982 RepID=UPI00232D9875|nr:hypothetical protein [Aquimarina algiphila]